jgi:uncharacterized membrane protein YphA (DoxX/SURF4 family)
LAGATGHLLQGQEWKFVSGVEALGFPVPVMFALAAALAESLSAFLLALELFTRVNAVVIAFAMLVAIYRHLSAGEARNWRSCI